MSKANIKKTDIVKMLVQMSGRYNYHVIFQDWVEAMAISIQNSCCLIHDRIWEEREQAYKNIMNKYTPEERQQFPIMFTCLADAFEDEEITDVLGEIYMSQKSGSSRLGQFFTPFHLSELCARMLVQQQLKEWDGETCIEVNEPSTGAGEMLLAVIKVLKEKGIDYQRKVYITAQDLDWNGVYMTYVQLSLLGANATVVQGDTLMEPYAPGKIPKSRVFHTPMRKGVLL